MKLDYKNIIENNLNIKKPVYKLLAYNNLLRAYIPSESTRLSPTSESSKLTIKGETKMKVTKLETLVLRVFYDTSMDCWGECTEDQNGSYNNVRDIAKKINLSEQQVGGVFTSLLNKNLIVDTKDSARNLPISDFVLGNVFAGNELLPEIAELLYIRGEK